MDLSMLNDRQREGVVTTEGPVLILAGAGSGKTRVLTHRVAYLIEHGVMPYNIMAITFTNKAAREMRERIDNMIDYKGNDPALDPANVWVATFHSSCVRILRKYCERIKYERNFTIYDSDDVKTVIKEVLKYLEIDPKKYSERSFINRISDAKNKLISASEFRNRAYSLNDYKEKMIADVYFEYQKRLKNNNAFDFDDLIMKTVELLSDDNNIDVRMDYQNRFKYIMVDEYQDTNAAQFELIRLLTNAKENLCVVGDDDQSIYKFRGADITNILDFELHYPSAKVIKLEQNYRSKGNILAAANAVIANNVQRKTKALWTEAEDGDKIDFQRFESPAEEAAFVSGSIAGLVRRGEAKYKDCAVLYRTNAQSKSIEEKLRTAGIPYKIIGGINFFSRKEIKDILAFLKTVDNANDAVAVKRIINIPRRGIGSTSILKIDTFAFENSISFYDALLRCREIPKIGKAADKIESFTTLITKLKDISIEQSVPSLIEEILDRTDYIAELKAEGTDEAKSRIENINELLNDAIAYVHDSIEAKVIPTLSGFLEKVALVADIDNYVEDDDYVVLMTLHGAKGLEFPRVYMIGMDDNLFPGKSATETNFGDNPEMEEERRLCYVGITRAKEHLSLTSVAARYIYREYNTYPISRFVREEIPKSLVNVLGTIMEPRYNDDYSDYQVGEYSVYQKPSGMGKPFLGTTYGSKSAATSTTPAYGKAFTVGSSTTAVANKNGTKIEKAELEYGVGDRVSHIKFKEGTVKDIIDEGRDYEVTVEFDGVGVKKMFASFAKLKKI